MFYSVSLVEYRKGEKESTIYITELVIRKNGFLIHILNPEFDGYLVDKKQ